MEVPAVAAVGIDEWNGKLMTRKNSGAFLLGTVASLAFLWACSADDGAHSSGNSAGGAAASGGSNEGTGGDAQAGGSTSSGGASSGGVSSGGAASIGGTGSGTGGTTESAEICDDTGNGTTRCEAFPSVCGNRTDYIGALFAGPGPDDIRELSTEPNTVYFGLEGDDSLIGWGNGSCLLGGDGDDTLEFGDEPFTPRPNIGIGGPGIDVWILDHPSEPPMFVDVATDEQIQFKAIGTFEADFIEVIADFSGSQSKKATTHIVYDPNSGRIWLDEDGGGSAEAPELLATVANYADVELTPANFAIAD